MEEAPQGTFQDELDWCIEKLEHDLLQQNPTSQGGQTVQSVLQVLRSQKAPFVKKRLYMNQVFGNYRLKMAEERQQKEKAESQVLMQEVSHPDSHSVAYRKCLKDGQSTSSAHGFTPSDNSFNFNFYPEPTANFEGALDENTEDSPAKGRQSEVNRKGSMFCTEDRSGFSFNFQIPEDAAAQNCEGHMSTLDTSGDQPSTNHLLSANRNIAEPQETSQNVSRLEDDCNTLGLSANQSSTLEIGVKELTDSPKKKKKKKKKNPCAQSEKKVEEIKADTEKSSPARDDGQSGVGELQRELDWCVEQLEIGLQRQKSTPKQVEEAMRAIKTLRSEKVQLVKKRQMMRTMFGDYRRKMEEERRKQLRQIQAAAKSARVIEVSETARRKNSKVFRKSAHKSTCTEKDLPADSQDSPVQEAANNGGFIFRSSQEPFCFQFF